MQVYKPFRLRGPLDAVHRMHQLSLSLFLSRFVPLAFVPSPPLSYLLCLMPPNPDPHSPLRSLPRDPFARFINLALLSPLVPPFLCSPLNRCSFAISTSFLRIAIASGKHDKASNFIRYRRLSTRFIFSGHSGIFARIHVRYLSAFREKNKACVATRSICPFRSDREPSAGVFAPFEILFRNFLRTESTNNCCLFRRFRF